VRHHADVARYAAFASNRLAFDDQPLSDVAAELPHWFDVEIRIPDPTVARRHLTAEWGSPRLEGVLASLSASLGLRVERSPDGKVITLVPAGA
jgi:ferric-dicitrate binding protein FerR (iron transport regulator)